MNVPNASKSAVQGSVASSTGAEGSSEALTSPLDSPFKRAALNLSHTAINLNELRSREKRAVKSKQLTGRTTIAVNEGRASRTTDTLH